MNIIACFAVCEWIEEDLQRKEDKRKPCQDSVGKSIAGILQAGGRWWGKQRGFSLVGGEK
jgi:hypothetical protein